MTESGNIVFLGGFVLNLSTCQIRKGVVVSMKARTWKFTAPNQLNHGLYLEPLPPIRSPNSVPGFRHQLAMLAGAIGTKTDPEPRNAVIEGSLLLI